MDILNVLKPYIEALVGQYGQVAQILASVIAIMGIARAIFKPLVTLVHAVVEQTATKKDDELLAKAESSKVFTAIKFVVDFLFSLKLPEKKQG